MKVLVTLKGTKTKLEDNILDQIKKDWFTGPGENEKPF